MSLGDLSPGEKRAGRTRGQKEAPAEGAAADAMMEAKLALAEEEEVRKLLFVLSTTQLTLLLFFERASSSSGRTKEVNGRRGTS